MPSSSHIISLSITPRHAECYRRRCSVSSISLSSFVIVVLCLADCYVFVRCSLFVVVVVVVVRRCLLSLFVVWLIVMYVVVVRRHRCSLLSISLSSFVIDVVDIASVGHRYLYHLQDCVANDEDV